MNYRLADRIHFTIDAKVFATKEEKVVYVPGHSLGEGYTRHIVELRLGDTADNPSSTKGPLYGPAFVVYDVSPMGTHTSLYKDSGAFYDAVVEFANLRAHAKLRDAADKASEAAEGMDDNEAYHVLSKAVDSLLDRV